MARLPDLVRLMLSLAVGLIVAGTGAVLAHRHVTWISSLALPSIAPTAPLFMWGWLVSCLLSSLGAFIAWRRVIPPDNVRIALGAFLFQALLAILWFYVFFARHELIAAFELIIFLWFAVALLLITLARVSGRAALVVLPCLIWVGYLVIINGKLVRLNFGGHA